MAAPAGWHPCAESAQLSQAHSAAEGELDGKRPSLREAVLDHITSSGVVTRREVLSHFHRDDEAPVGAMLGDLCDSGLLFRSRRGPGTAYRAASPTDLRRLGESAEGLDEIARVLIYREGPLWAAELCDLTRLRLPPCRRCSSASCAKGGFAATPISASRANR